MGNPPYERTKYIIEEQPFYEEHYETCYGAYDICILFVEISNNLINKLGKFGFITSNKYLVADYGIKLREFLQKDSFVEQLVDLTECPSSFEKALISPLITITRKQPVERVKIAILKKNNLSLLNKLQVVTSNSENENFTVEFRNSQDLQDKFSGHLNIYLYGKKEILAKKIYSTSKLLSDVAQIRTGIMGFEYWKMDDIIQDSKSLSCNQVKILPPSLINRYSNLWGIELVDLYKKKYGYPVITFDRTKIDDNTWKLFKSEKIVVRGVARCVSATFDEEGQGILVATHAIISNRYSDYHVLALLNSRLFDWLHIVKFYSARIPQGSLRYPVSFYKQLPIRRICFTTPKKEREKLSEEGKKVYEKCLENGDWDSLLFFVGQRLKKQYIPDPELVKKHNADPLNKDFQIREGELIERSDVVHDLLAFLAEKMIEYNKEKNKETKSFLGWLEREVGTKVQNLTGKTTIRKYHETTADNLMSIFRKNKKKLQIDPSRRDFQDRLSTEFDTSIQKLTPLKRKIEMTDHLIDQIVYKLYGLTEAEIKIVEESFAK